MAVDGISIRVLDHMSALGQKQTCAAHKPMCKCHKRTFAAAIEMSTKGQKVTPGLVLKRLPLCSSHRSHQFIDGCSVFLNHSHERVQMNRIYSGLKRRTSRY